MEDPSFLCDKKGLLNEQQTFSLVINCLYALLHR